MKTLNYKLDELIILQKETHKVNPEHTQEYINSIINEGFTGVKFDKFDVKIIVDKDIYSAIYINRLTNETIREDQLPITVRDISNKLFNKLYWKRNN